jgi:hypothetical protein
MVNSSHARNPMLTSTPLNGDAYPTPVAPGITIHAPGLGGSVTRMSAADSITRSDGGSHEAPLVLEFDITMNITPIAPAAPTRSGIAQPTTSDGEPAIVLRVPELDPHRGYAVLHTDEAGVSRWIFPQPSTDAASTRGGAEIVFHLPRASAPLADQKDGEATTRGRIAKLGRRLVRVLTWATDDIVGRGALAVAQRWEEAKRPYGLRLVESAHGGAPIDWAALGSGRALLLLHGTFSTAGAAFASLEPQTYAALREVYRDRIFAFEHPSLHHDPQHNIARLLDMLPPDAKLDLDIIAHSRGGLVGRELTERLHDHARGDREITIRRAIFVAAPNLGTILTDPDHGITMLDRYTNLLTSLPDNAYTLTMEGVLMLVKLVLHGSLKALPGLQSMLPGGPFLDRLARSPRSSTEYYALAANFTPTSASLLQRFGYVVADKLIDGVFGEDNDGVVPTRGALHGPPASPNFPIPADRRHVFASADLINHCNFFASPVVNDKIRMWLRG